ncbi:hypothetical protein Tco_1360897 [Tanacetum coccineum]
MVEKSKLENLQGIPVDATLYRGMIGSLMYLTSSRTDLIYAVCLCAWYEAKPTEKHLHAVKRIFRYLKGTINMGLWYSKDSSMSLTAYSDVDHARYSSVLRQQKYNCSMLQQRSTLKSKAHRYTLPFHEGAGGEWNCGTLLCSNGYQLADIFTKPLPRERFNFLIEKLSMRSMSPETLKRLTEEEDE